MSQRDKALGVGYTTLNPTKMGRGLGDIDDRHGLDVRILHLRGMRLEGSQFLVDDGADIDKNGRQKLLRRQTFEKQQIRHGAGCRHDGAGDVPVILVRVLAEVGVHRIRLDLPHDLLDLHDRLPVAFEFGVRIPTEEHLTGADDLGRLSLFC